MPFAHDDIKDNGLTIVTGANRRLDITHTEATTFAQATATYSVGNKVGISASLVAGTPSGRAVRVAAIADGAITATSTGAADDAQYWAITDTTNSKLLLTGPLTAGQMVTSGNTFSLAQFDAYTFTNPA